MKQNYFPQTHYVSEDNVNFYHLNNHLFDPINLSDIIKNSTDLNVKKDNRPDLTTKDYDYSSSYIKIVNIINGKRRGIYDYKKDEKIIVPMPADIDNVNSEYSSLLYSYNKPRHIDVDIKNELSNSIDSFSQVFSEKDKVIIYSYILKTLPLVTYNEDNLKAKFPGII